MAKRRGKRGTTTLAILPSLQPEEPPAIQRRTHKVMKAEWSDPDDMRPNQRAGRTISGHRARCILRFCIQRHGSRCSFSEAHVLAADRLRHDFDAGRLGFSNSARASGLPVQAVVYRPSQGPGAAALAQVAAAKRFVGAWKLFGPWQQALLTLTLLQNVSLGRAAVRLVMPRDTLREQLVLMLDKLVIYYDVGHERVAA